MRTDMPPRHPTVYITQTSQESPNALPQLLHMEAHQNSFISPAAHTHSYHSATRCFLTRTFIGQESQRKCIKKHCKCVLFLHSRSVILPSQTGTGTNTLLNNIIKPHFPQSPRFALGHWLFLWKMVPYGLTALGCPIPTHCTELTSRHSVPYSPLITIQMLVISYPVCLSRCDCFCPFLCFFERTQLCPYCERVCLWSWTHAFLMWSDE